ncbi:MAG: tRNA epoxyqueuosine(34) reductase QueG [Nibricoccus sp.]
MNTSREELRARLLALGFDDVRFVRLGAVEGRFLRDWLGQGMHGDMQWMERSVEKRLDPRQVLPGARSAVLLGVNYWPGAPEAPLPDQPIWARYALYSDYHDTLKPALVAAGRALEEICGLAGTDYRYYVDTGPVVERGWAARAGLGFIGKNGMLISRRHGNWLFLAAVLTTADLEPDEPVRVKVGDGEQIGLLCGKCTRCIDACPTGAITQPGVVDARLCISYQTIENRGIIPRELRRKIGTHIYGCDVCLEVCPWNRFAQQGRRVLLEARDGLARLSLRELLELTPERFAAVFKGTAIKRVKLAGVLRNASIVAANAGAIDCLEALVRLAGHELPVVRAHAVWAVFRLAGPVRAGELLAALRSAETAPEVLAEYDACEQETVA